MSRKKNADEAPTELEAVVLGVIWQDGPCTAYAIRKSFVQSPSPRWSGSAGAIYPLLRRMEQLGLIASAPSPGVQRKQRDYVLSRQGLTVLRRWLRQLNPGIDSGLVHDPLRTKIFFLNVLSKPQARKFVNKALIEIRNQLDLLQADCDRNPVNKNPTGYFAARNALLMTQARVAWLEEVAQTLEKIEKGKSKQG